MYIYTDIYLVDDPSAYLDSEQVRTYVQMYVCMYICLYLYI
jgi:translation initiation factor RLI1